jgi:perosamine synthetase
MQELSLASNGMNRHHVPVLLNEVLEHLAPKSGETFIDGTLGDGGHAEEILERIAPNGVLLGIDLEQGAINRAGIRLARFGSRFIAERGNYRDIAAIAEKRGIPLIEDSAEALGTTYKGKRSGSFGIGSTFRFHRTKTLTTGEGGMVTTNNPELARRLRLFRNHGIDLEARVRQHQGKGQWYYEMTELGYNYRLTDIGCALGLSQLRKLPGNISRRREVARYYANALAELPGVITPVEQPEAKCAWHLYPIRLELDRFTAGRKEVFQALRAENIGVQVHYIPVHLHPYYRKRFGYCGGEYPVAEDAYERLITLPLFHSITDQDAADVVTALAKVVDHLIKR